MKLERVLLVMAMLIGLASVCAAQMEMPKPAPELKAYDYFVGNWKLAGEAKPSPMGPGGKMTMTEDARWMKGGFYVVIDSKFAGAGMGEGTGVSIMGYDPDAKKYVYYEFNSFGEAVKSTGSFDGKVWTWNSDDKMGKGRFTMTITSPKSYDFAFDISKDGTNWMNVMNGKATKVK